MKSFRIWLLAAALSFSPTAVFTAHAQQAVGGDDSAVPDTVVPAEAADGPQTAAEEPNAVGPIVKLMEGIQNKDWVLASAAAILILVWIWNVFILPRVISSDKHPKWKQASPYISIGVGVVFQFSSAIVAGNDWTDALNTALMTGFAASGMWSGGGKHLGNYVEKKVNGKADSSSSSAA